MIRRRGNSPIFGSKILTNPTRYEAYTPYVKDVDDGAFLAIAPKKYQQNSWGLYDMHGNVAEWTRSTYQPYPLKADQPSSDDASRVVRGGSWRDRPYRATSSFRVSYPPFQKVYNVGFRVIVEE